MKVLLIEDNPGDARLVQETLSPVKEQIEIEWVDLFSKGIARLQKGDIDIALIDLSLPDSKGPETVRKIKREARHIPIVVLTANTDSNSGIQAVRDGAQDYLLKENLNCDLLLRALRYSCERNKNQRLLQKKIEELERMNQIMMDREERVLELKDQIKLLEEKLAEKDLSMKGP